MRKTDSEEFNEIILAAKTKLEEAKMKQAAALQKVYYAKIDAEKAREALLHNLQKSVTDQIIALEATIEGKLFTA